MSKRVLRSTLKFVAGGAALAFLFYNKFNTTGFLVMGGSIAVMLICGAILMHMHYNDDDSEGGDGPR